MSKRNIEALGKVNFSAKIDFSVEGGLKIAEIEHIENIEPSQPLEYTNELTEIFNSIRLTKKQKELLKSNYLSLRETYFLRGKTAFRGETLAIYTFRLTKWEMRYFPPGYKSC